MEQRQVTVLGATRLAVGLSSIARISVASYQVSQAFKIGSGGGTLEIVQVPASLGPGTGATGWGTGYRVGASEIINLDAGSMVYLAATGATMNVDIMLGYSSGSTAI